MKLKMHHTDEGLTVGELTIAISFLIILFLVWSGFTGKENPNDSFLRQSYSTVIHTSEFSVQEKASESSVNY